MRINEILDERYKIISLIGKGGTSTVYKAINLRIDSEWAIKEISKKNEENFDLLVEPNLLKNLQHHALPRIIDIIDKEDAVYIVEDFIDGTSLEKLVKEISFFPERKVLKWAKELCGVLDYLHNQKPNPIIYRDMKPANIMLTKRENIKLIDFGIAREYKEEVQLDTVIMGTKGYAAPEQYGKHQTDERSDIYSLGVTLYNLITGKNPNEPPFEILPVRQINPNLSEGIEHIIKKCTKSDPTQRYQTIVELRYDLDNIETLSSEYKKRQDKIKRGLMYHVGGALMSLLVVGYGVKSIANYKNDEFLTNISIAVTTAERTGVDQALPLFKKAIEMKKGRDEGYLELAKTYINELSYEKALDVLQIKALENNKNIINNDEYNYWIGVGLFSLGDYAGANESFLKVKKGNFVEYDFYKTISKILASPENIEKEDEIVKTIESLNAKIEQSTDESFRLRGYITIADIYRDNPMIFKDSEDKQINILEKAIAKNGNNTILHERVAQAYYQKGLLLMGEGKDHKKEMGKALESYKVLLKLGYETSSIYRNVGLIYKQLDNIKAAKNMFNKLIEKYPKDFKGYVELAYIYIQEGNKQEAVKNYDLAKKHNTIENNIELTRLEVLVNELKDK